MAKIYNSVEELIGKTPIIRLKNIEKKYGLQAKLLAKLEMFNPAGSVKDRVALSMINDAEEEGLLKPGGTIIEPTSGNTGIGICAIAAARGYKAIIVMPDSMSIERIKLMKAYGAEVVLSDGKEGMAGAIKCAEELHEKEENSIIAGQFVNPANPKIHKNTTGVEIFEELDGEIDYFVAGVGTGGTITGVGEYLKSKNPDIKIIAAEPNGSPVLSGSEAGTHKIQGIGAGFIPEILNTEILDEIIRVKCADAYELAREIAKNEGILVGISSGAALWASIEIAKRPEAKGKTVVTLLPDTGERYLSTELYD
ncbi:MAG: cysteine synthase A [Clostridia bacterium]|nr:cysteine synthase A [Clostridia bacterium]